ncbi:Os08g0325400 [Oryza sativa Japonica Group]|uniref:Os08g0325400 protein n=1 Tax=Oryza sativa subsp. japonica TaxID=39947 RepID=A0A0N7KPN3_ORYSJ|nr:Os08g0325400 [Oryza sativa Japonica Group]
MASPRHVSGLSPGAAAGAHHMLLEAAYNDNLRGFKNLANMLDTGRGCLRETVGEARQAGVQGMEGAGVLHLAAINGSMNVVRYLVETMRFDVDDLDKEGRTPLVSAVHSGRIGTVKYLLDHGANKDKASEGGLTPLHSAAGLGDCKMVKLLLAKGAYVDPLSDCGTPLHLAATEGQDGTMKILLDHKADYNKMVLGMTPLFVAINHASEKCAKLLVKAGADINGDYVLTALTDTSFNSVFALLTGRGAPVSRSITELKSLGSMAFQSKNYLHAAGFYSKLGAAAAQGCRRRVSGGAERVQEAATREACDGGCHGGAECGQEAAARDACDSGGRGGAERVQELCCLPASAAQQQLLSSVWI